MPKKKKKSQYQVKNYFQLPHALLDHPDYLSMDWTSQALLTHMMRFYNGYNNGDISIPISIMEKRGWSRGSLERGKKELLKNNWIVITRQGFNRTCSLYALSWVPMNAIIS